MSDETTPTPTPPSRNAADALACYRLARSCEAIVRPHLETTEGDELTAWRRVETAAGDLVFDARRLLLELHVPIPGEDDPR